MDLKDYPVECTTVAKISINQTNEPHYIITCWGDDVKIIVVHNDQYWKGMLNPKNFEYFYKILDLTREQYITNTKRALTTNCHFNPYLFELINNELIWKVLETTTDIKIIHGSTKLPEYSPEGGAHILVETLLLLKEYADRKLETQERESVELAKQLSSVIDKCEEFSKLKNEMENDLYGKFMHLLNAKKEQVVVMEDFIGNRKDPKFIKGVPALKSAPPRQIHAMSDSDSDST